MEVIGARRWPVASSRQYVCLVNMGKLPPQTTWVCPPNIPLSPFVVALQFPSVLYDIV